MSPLESIHMNHLQICKKFFNRSSSFLRTIPVLLKNPLVSPILVNFSTYASARFVEPTSPISQNSLNLSPIKLAQVFASLERKPSIAYSFFRDTQAFGYPHDICTYSVIIRILGRSGMHFKLVALFKDVISANGELGFEISTLFGLLSQGSNSSCWVTMVSDSLVKAYAMCSKPREAIGAFRELASLGFVPAMRGCNFLLNYLVDIGELERVVEVYNLMRGFGIEPDRYMATILIKAFGRRGESDKVLAVLETMDEIGVKLDLITFSTILNYCMGNCGIEVLRKMRKDGVAVDVVASNIVISGLCKERKLEEADEVLEDMKRHNVKTNSYSYGCLMKGHCENGNILRVINLLEEMAMKEIKTNHVILSFVLQSLCKMGKYSVAVEYFHKFKSSMCYIDEVLYNIAISACCKMKNMRDAMKLFEEMKGQGLTPDKKHFTTLIRGFCNLGEISNARKVFKDMVKLNVEPDIVTYNTLISGFCRNGLLEAASILIKSIKEICSDGDIERALRVFKLMSSKLISELCMEGDVVRASRVFKSMLKIHVIPDLISYNQIVASYSQLKDMENARDYFMECEKQNISPDVILYTTLIDGYWKVHQMQEACKLFLEMKHREINPDVVAQTVMLDGYLKYILNKDLWEIDKRRKLIKFEAMYLELLKDFEILELGPDLVWYTVVIDGLSKMDHLQRAEEQFNEMIKRDISPDSFPYTALLHGYFTRGDVDKAEALFKEMLDKGIQPDIHTYCALGNRVIV